MLDGWEECIYTFQVEAFTIDHLTIFVQDLEKYKVVQISPPCRTVEIRRISIFFGNFIP